MEVSAVCCDLSPLKGEATSLVVHWVEAQYGVPSFDSPLAPGLPF